MLVPILLSLIWAICSTSVIQPWFWKNLCIRKTLEGEPNNIRGFRKGRSADGLTPKDLVIVQVIFSIFVFLISLLCYLANNWNWIFASFFPIICVLLLNIWYINWGYNKNKKLKSLILLSIFIISFVPMIAYSDVYNKPVEPKILEAQLSQIEERAPTISAYGVKEVFKADSVSGPTYTNKKFVYVLSGGVNGLGVAIVEPSNGETSIFIPCNYEQKDAPLVIRKRYPFEYINYKGVVVDNSNVPYWNYQLINSSFFGENTLKDWVLQNAITGELTTYETLPEFAQ